ncbi:MAG: hypothetical protein K0U68_11965 [Gammaproteobacteria bacterium]|nr:hypothetical protein [Gammaproteobacteria bacterium]
MNELEIHCLWKMLKISQDGVLNIIAQAGQTQMTPANISDYLLATHSLQLK